MLENTRPMTADEYADFFTWLCEKVVASRDTLAKVLGEPFLHTDPNFPDDETKVDHCWGVIDTETGGRVTIWDFRGSSQQDTYSVGFLMDEDAPPTNLILWQRIRAAIEKIQN